jgi:hypothetical protein
MPYILVRTAYWYNHCVQSAAVVECICLHLPAFACVRSFVATFGDRVARMHEPTAEGDHAAHLGVDCLTCLGKERTTTLVPVMQAAEARRGEAR